MANGEERNKVRQGGEAVYVRAEIVFPEELLSRREEERMKMRDGYKKQGYAAEKDIRGREWKD